MTENFQPWLQNHIFTASELEAYLLCPFRFYAQAFLKLAPEVTWEIEMTPAETGQILHRVLEKFLKGSSRSEEKILSLLEGEIESFKKDRPHLSPILLELQREKMKRTLRSFVQILHEKTPDERTLQPRYFEWEFGKNLKPLEILLSSGEMIRLRGRIDRIDVDTRNKRFLVIDYKTGSTRISGKQITAGNALQLPIYILAVQKLLLPDYEPIGGIYFHLSDMTMKDGLLHADRLPAHLEIHPRSSSLIPGAKWDNTFSIITKRIGEITSEIQTGTFLSHDEPCEPYCPYKDICRIRSTYLTPEFPIDNQSFVA